MIKLALVTAYLGMDGWRCTVDITNYEEGAKTYHKYGKRLPKDSLLKLETKLLPSHRCFNRFTYCKVEDIEQAKQSLVSELIKQVDHAYGEASQCYNKSTEEPKWIEEIPVDLPPSGELVL